MDQRIIDLHHDYVHDHCDRRKFLEQAGRIVGSAGAAAALLPVLDGNFANAQTIAEDDPRIRTERVSFEGVTGSVNANLVIPTAPGPHPGIVVVHEAGGLTPHQADVARRLAIEGFVALGVDFLSPAGGTPGPGEGRAFDRIRTLNPEETVQNGVAAVAYLRSRSETTESIGAVGFCWGGRVTQALSVNDPSLNAVVVFYGQPPHPSMAPNLNAPLLMNYADVMLDMNNTGEAILYRAELDRLGKTYEFHMYEGAQHGFNNDTNEPRYNQAAAELAWGRTIDWFKQYLS
jgi:carboxymethylenebutenolidase